MNIENSRAQPSNIRDQADVYDMIYLPKLSKPAALKRLLQKVKSYKIFEVY
jgi:hypothetical protein